MAYYDFKKKPALTTKEGEKDVLYPSIVYSGKITSEELIQELAECSSISAGELEGALKDLLKLIGRHLGQGYQVELGDFGVFSGKITSRKVEDPKDIRSPSIHFNGVNFRPSKALKKQVSGELKRDKWRKFRHSNDTLSIEQRKLRMMKHLDEYGFINRVSYTQLTGRLKDVALKDLREFEKEGIIESKGRGNQMHFVKTKPIAE